MLKTDWWKGNVLYQIYPRSFADSNNDGIGDLRGITSRLDYIKDLGVKGIWISPFYPSPMKDFGYDVSDFRGIDPLFGSLEDFNELLNEANKRDLGIIIDMVFSHTSDQHPWFMDSCNRGEYEDWYVWANAREDGSAPNNWVSVFGGPAWEFDARRGQYYLHNFLKEQPDLNFHHEPVQEEVLDIAKFWLDRGVKGFRLDVVNFYFHDQLLRDNPPRTEGVQFATQFEGEDPYSHQQHIFDKSRPEMFGFLKKLRSLLNQYDGVMSIGEIGDDHPYELSATYTAGQDHLHTTYNTDMMSGTHKQIDKNKIIAPFERFEQASQDSWPSWAFSNHDVVRAISRWHNTDPSGFGHDPQRAQMLIALLACLRGTTFLYQGEELGLPEVQIPYEQLQDPWGIHLWPEWQGRDGCRTPMPWNNSENGGFCQTTPWLPVPDIHKELSAETQEKTPDSTLNFTKKFLGWRHQQPAFQHGELYFIQTKDNDLLAFQRSDENTTFFCYFNLGKNKLPLELPADHRLKTVYSGHGNDNNKELQSNSFIILKQV